MIALLILTQRHDIMGSFANRRFVAIAAAAMAAAVLALNGLLILQAGNAALAL
jgi:Mn2+/Fe2+ NRAMP family transporter